MGCDSSYIQYYMNVSSHHLLCHLSIKRDKMPDIAEQTPYCSLKYLVPLLSFYIFLTKLQV